MSLTGAITGADEVGIIWYGPLFRTLGLTEPAFPPQVILIMPPLAAAC